MQHHDRPITDPTRPESGFAAWLEQDIQATEACCDLLEAALLAQSRAEAEACFLGDDPAAQDLW